MQPFEIKHIQEPRRLSLAWIPPTSSGKEHRTWRRVAEVLLRDPVTPPVLNYLIGDADYEEALSQGFNGYPAFPLTSITHEQGVMETLLKRLPPRSRGDFPQYLDMFRIPRQAVLSDFALLGYTEARLPSDGFALLLRLEDFTPPFEIVLGVAGFRYESQKTKSELSVGMETILKPIPHQMDKHAIEVWHENDKIGFLPRLHVYSLSELIAQDRITATIERVNGSSERPLVRLFLSAR